MRAETVIAVVSIASTTLVAITVPRMTFRLALRQEQVRWLREQRTALYVDLLTEAYAEQQYLEYDLADDDTREHMRSYFEDLRLKPPDRARLGARATAFGSHAVNAAFNEMQRVALRATLGPRNEGVQGLARVEVGRAMDELQAAVRHELGTPSIDTDRASR